MGRGVRSPSLFYSKKIKGMFLDADIPLNAGVRDLQNKRFIRKGIEKWHLQSTVIFLAW